MSNPYVHHVRTVHLDRTARPRTTRASRLTRGSPRSQPWTSTTKTVDILGCNWACRTVQNSFEQFTHNNQSRQLNRTCPSGQFDLDHLHRSVLYTLRYEQCVLVWLYTSGVATVLSMWDISQFLFFPISLQTQTSYLHNLTLVYPFHA